MNPTHLEPSVGFLHDSSDYQTKQSLVYDLQEPFRWLSDTTVIEAFESEGLKLSDFYFAGDDYRYHLEPVAKQRFINLMRERFNSGAKYRGEHLKWDTIIEHKAIELCRFMGGKSSSLNFAEPPPKSLGYGNEKLRDRILALTQSDARQLNIGKSTLHYLRRNAQGAKTLRVYGPVMSRLKDTKS